MIKKFFAPFSSKVTAARENNIGMAFSELYFYVLLPYGMYHYGELVYSYMDIYNDAVNLPWYTFFSDGYRSMMFVFASLPLLCIIWQFFSLRTFSSRFFIPLWCFLVVFLLYSITYYFTMNNIAFLHNTYWSIPYGGVIYYFYVRKPLFEQTKKNNMPAEK